MLSEELPIARRARGQSFGGLAGAVGGGFAYSSCRFRGLRKVVAMDVRAVGWRRSRCCLRWRGCCPKASDGKFPTPSGMTARTRFYDVFQPLYRKRSITMIICALAAAISTTGANNFAYYHAVSVVGLSAPADQHDDHRRRRIGLFGFPLGAWSAERFGRVPTVVVFGISITAGHCGISGDRRRISRCR